MGTLQDIGRKIALLRIKRGMSQEDLAGKAELSRNYISNIENDKVSFSVNVLLKISKGLDVDPKDLLE